MPREADMFKDLQHAQSYVREKGFRMIGLKFSDLAGRWRHLTVPASQFNEHLMRDGVGFDA
jgi:glutamine synthetase